MALTQFAVLPYVVAGIIVLTRGADGLYWLVPAIVISFIKAILDAWVLLVEITVRGYRFHLAWLACELFVWECIGFLHDRSRAKTLHTPT